MTESNETIFWTQRSRSETTVCSYCTIKQRGAIMLTAILNSIYRELIRASLSGAKIAGA